MSSVLEGLELYPIRIPMRHRFRGVDHREAVLINGPSGWGEFSPFPGYRPEVTTRWLKAALELACQQLPEPRRSVVPVNVTVPAVDPDTAAILVLESGATTAKVKIGNPGDTDIDDEERLSAVRGALGNSGHLRIDVNASWDLETATSRLEALARFDLQYVEQPVAAAKDMAELSRRTGILIAADEIIRQSDDPLRALEESAAGVLVLKCQPMGGVKAVVDLAARASIPVVISSALETSVGMYAGLLAASLLEDLPYACGLGTVALIEGDPTMTPLLPSNGMLDVRRPKPDPGLIERWKPDRAVSADLLRSLSAAAEGLD
jgi:O-succinylbenzoate synthase